MNCTSYKWLNDNIYQEKPSLIEGPKLLFTQGTVGFEILGLSRYLFLPSFLQSSKNLIPYLSLLFLMYRRKTNLPRDNVIYSSNNNSLVRGENFRENSI